MGNKHGFEHRKECGSRCWEDSCHWRLFQHDNFEGHYNDMCQGRFNDIIRTYTGKSSWTNWQFKNDDVSSFGVSSARFQNAAGFEVSADCRYTFCEHSDGSGNCMIVDAKRGSCCTYTLSDLEKYGLGNDKLSYLKVEVMGSRRIEGCDVRSAYVEPGPMSYIEPPNDESYGYEPNELYTIELVVVLSLFLVICAIINGWRCLRMRNKNKRNKYEKVSQIASDIDTDDLANIEEQEQKRLNKIIRSK